MRLDPDPCARGAEPPPVGGVAVAMGYAPGGYMPVQNTHYAGEGY